MCSLRITKMSLRARTGLANSCLINSYFLSLRLNSDLNTSMPPDNTVPKILASLTERSFSRRAAFGGPKYNKESGCSVQKPNLTPVNSYRFTGLPFLLQCLLVCKERRRKDSVFLESHLMKNPLSRSVVVSRRMARTMSAAIALSLIVATSLRAQTPVYQNTAPTNQAPPAATPAPPPSAAPKLSQSQLEE